MNDRVLTFGFAGFMFVAGGLVGWGWAKESGHNPPSWHVVGQTSCVLGRDNELYIDDHARNEIRKLDEVLRDAAAFRYLRRDILQESGK